MIKKKEVKWINLQASDLKTRTEVERALKRLGFLLVGAGTNLGTGVSDMRMEK